MLSVKDFIYRTNFEIHHFVYVECYVIKQKRNCELARESRLT